MADKSHLLALCAVLPACASNGASADAPARLASPNPQAHAEVAHIIATALHSESVAIADDAFVATSSISIEPVRIRDANGALLQGRETRPPERFLLLKRGTHCVLKHERTGEEWELKNASCVAEASR